MSPLQARRLVGQPDIVDRLRNFPVGPSDMMEPMREAAAEIECLRTMVATVNHDFSMSRIENERLRTALRAVRASTDPLWIKQIISDALRETP